jgi:phage shock protein PspC (stress-responsive transcriptional regulator)
MDDRLYRSRTDRILTGVAGGLAERMNVDPSLVRVVWVLLAIFSGGIFALIYLVMAVVVPERPAGATSWPATGAPGAGQPSEPPPPGSWIGPDGQPVPQAPATGPAADTGQRRPGTGAIVVGGVLIVVGTWAFLTRLVPGLDSATTWPILVVLLGIALVVFAFVRPSRS